MLGAWFGTPLGRYLLAREQAWFDRTVADIFGFHAIQLGVPGVDLLRENRITHKLRVAHLGEPDPADGWRLPDRHEPEAYSEWVRDRLDDGARLVGGCCGTTPGHIAAIALR